MDCITLTGDTSGCKRITISGPSDLTGGASLSLAIGDNYGKALDSNPKNAGALRLAAVLDP